MNDADRDFIAAMSKRAANARLDELWEQSPEVVDVVTATVEIASPLAGPQRILAEVLSALGLDR